MAAPQSKSSRRSFLTRGGAALGAGTAAAAATTFAAREPAADDLRHQLSRLEDVESIRQLQLTFTALMAKERYAQAAELFDQDAHLDLSGVSASGKAAILELLAQRYPLQEVPVLHRGYRQSALQQQADHISLAQDGLGAVAAFHVEVELCTPLEADCTAAKMARLQGLMAESHWESGRFDARYAKVGAQWKIESLIYRSA